MVSLALLSLSWAVAAHLYRMLLFRRCQSSAEMLGFWWLSLLGATFNCISTAQEIRWQRLVTSEASVLVLVKFLLSCVLTLRGTWIFCRQPKSRLGQNVGVVVGLLADSPSSDTYGLETQEATPQQFQELCHTESPYYSNGLWQVLSWGWVGSLLGRGYVRPLQHTDFYALGRPARASSCLRQVMRYWRPAKTDAPSSSLARAFRKVWLFKFLLVTLWLFLENFCMIFQAVLVGRLATFFNDPSRPDSEGLVLVLGLCVSVTVVVFTHHQYFWYTEHYGCQMRSAAIALVYDKALRLSHSALGGSVAGQAANLVSNDVERMVRSSLFCWFLLTTPVEFIIIAWILYQELGVSAFVGLGGSLLLVPLQIWFGQLFGRLRGKTAIKTDERVKLMSEVVGGIEVIKMFAWEEPYAQKVNAVRTGELYRVKQSSMLRAVNLGIYFSSGTLLALLTFAAYAMLGNTLTVDKLFITMGLLNVLKKGMSLFVPFGVESLSELVVTFTRLQAFLSLDETETGLQQPILHTNQDKTPSDRSNGYGKNYQSEVKCKSISDKFALSDRQMMGDGSGDLNDEDYECPAFSPVVEPLPSVSLRHFSASWTSLNSNGKMQQEQRQGQLNSNGKLQQEERQAQLTLQGVSFSVSAGELLGVVGPVGSGKTSVLMAVLGELPPLRTAHQGQDIVNREVFGTVAYVGQSAWILSGTVLHNICLALPFDAEWMDRVISACALTRDLELLPNGLYSEIGPKGVTLSGGQKARISLARAVYADRDIYLLDDPLSAVDPAVAKHLFQQCICGLLQHKARILVTHQVQFLHSVGKVLVLGAGGIVHGLGEYEQVQELLDLDLQQSSHSSSSLELLQEADQDSDMTSPLITIHSGARTEGKLGEGELRLRAGGSELALETLPEGEATQGRDADGATWQAKQKAKVQDKDKILEEEERVMGEVTLDTYRIYAQQGGGISTMSLLLLLGLLSQAGIMLAEWWVADWAADNSLGTQQHRRFNIGVYSSLVFFTVGITIFKFVFWFVVLLRASQSLHDKMLSSILSCPLQFFATQPLGRILNRFSSDLGTLDDLLPGAVIDVQGNIFAIAGVAGLAMAVNPIIILVILPMAYFSFKLREYYLRSSRDIKRLEATSRSPIQDILATSLQGLTTIRAFGLQSYFTKQMLAAVDMNTNARFHFGVTNRWLGVRVDALCAVFISCMSLASLWVRGSVPVEFVGLALVYSLSMMAMFQWVIRQSTELENQMTSTERIIRYTHLPTEAAWDRPADARLPHYWPTNGAIELVKLTTSYDKSFDPSLPPAVGSLHPTSNQNIEEKRGAEKGDRLVLNGLTCKIPARAKVGIVGRTGAGKSSFMRSLFRLVEFQGDLLIDNVSARTLGLHKLRRSLAVIPQEPILFSGTVRYNLDPFHEHSETALRTALAQASMDKVVVSLEHPVAEGGSNFSIGERQLLCLARALLRRTSVLVMDEATANVDQHTDAIIQETVTSRFQDCTVLVIAHRLQTVISNDLIMVLDAGRLVQFGEPHQLLQEESGPLLAMIKKTGPKMADFLRQKAYNAYADRLRLKAQP
eukprot:gb/GEZN01000315.1/.p1 GENE.gb/GEZN01000315.1/~~gb/GEZN01000315.1/.p1  ORF type:complete len:1656 (-),score=281.42 gb/GEZN01000315.1/:61-4743(-)